MQITASKLFLSLLIFISGLSVQSNAEPISIDELSGWPAFQSPSLSQDGEHVLGLIRSEDHDLPVLSVWKTSDLSATPDWIPSEEMIYEFGFFFGNDKLAWTARDNWTSSIKHFETKLLFSDLDGDNIDEPLQETTVGKSTARSVYSFSIFHDFEDGERYQILSATTSGDSVVEMNASTGRRKNIAISGENASFIRGSVNPVTGDILAKEELVTTGSGYVIRRLIRADANSSWEVHPKLSFDFTNRNTLDIVGFDGSADRLVVLTDIGTEHVEARVYTISTKKWDPEPLFAVPNFDIVSIQTRRTSKDAFPEIIGISVGGPYIEQFFIDEYWGGVHNQLKSQFRNEQVSFIDRREPWQAGRHMAIVSIGSSNRPNQYLLYDDGKFTKLGERRPGLDVANLPQSKWVTYPARDGLQVPGILSLPVGYDKEKDGPIPLVVHPHGGPWSRDYMGWDGSGWVPFLTSRGVAVLQPQYRGSSGLGMTLWKAGDEEWGQKMQDDKDDGAAWLVAEGIADPDRMAIYGYSYGGFAAIAASVRPDSPYNCAIAGAGVSNLAKLGNLWGGNRISRAYQGWTVDGMDPIRNVDKANIPILLYHGDYDRQADTYHSREFYRAMKSKGKDVEYHEIDKMWHQYPWRPEWKREILELMDYYLSSEKCRILD